MLKAIVLLCIVFATKGAVLTGSLPLDSSVIPLTPQLDGRIVGGQECSIAKHPHQIALRYRRCSTCAYSHLCGGSIYKENIIVTAAHCLVGRAFEDMIVVAGTVNRSGADGIVVRVESIAIHEHYNAVNTDNDVGVIFLSIPLPINNLTIAAIPLADVHPDNGVKSHVTGWGTTTEAGLSSNKLMEVEVPIVSNELCNEAYGEGRITDSMLCAGIPDGGKDACQGDSGGPLVVNGELAGIVSWGRGCARPDFPGVYASVSYLKSWILDTIAKNDKLKILEESTFL